MQQLDGYTVDYIEPASGELDTPTIIYTINNNFDIQFLNIVQLILFQRHIKLVEKIAAKLFNFYLRVPKCSNKTIFDTTSVVIVFIQNY